MPRAVACGAGAMPDSAMPGRRVLGRRDDMRYGNATADAGGWQNK